jgi:hypothetical protein
MNPDTALVLTWVVVVAVIAGYVWFVAWRYRVDKRKKAGERKTDDQLTAALARLGTPPPAAEPTAVEPTEPTGSAAPTPEPTPTRTPAPTPSPPPSPTPTVTPVTPEAATVASSLRGITLPDDLVPLTTMAERELVGDRVAFWTDTAAATTVGPAFADELERLGYTVQPLDERTLLADRDATHLTVMIHPNAGAAVIGTLPGFTTVPPTSVVVEVWLPR